MVKKILLQKILPLAIFLLIFTNILVIVSGHAYLYKAINNKPSIDDYRIFENRVIETGDHHPWQIYKHYNLIPVSDELLRTLRQYRTVAILLIQNDSIIVEDYWGEYSEESFSNSFSVSNSIVSALTGIAINEGYIKSIDQPVCEFLPGFDMDGKENITIRHLLTMTSGLSFNESYITPVNLITQSYYGNDLTRVVNSLKLEYTPGKHFRYKSWDTQILGMLISVASGVTLAEYASEKLWKPIGAVNIAKWSTDRQNGIEKAFCCFHSNARDLARLGKLYMENGKWNDIPLIPEDFVKESLSPHLFPDDKGDSVYYYGFQWWLGHFQEEEFYYAMGNLGQYVIVFPETKTIIVRLGHERPNTWIDHHPTEMLDYIRLIKKHVIEIKELASAKNFRQVRYNY